MMTNNEIATQLLVAASRLNFEDAFHPEHDLKELASELAMLSNEVSNVPVEPAAPRVAVIRDKVAAAGITDVVEILDSLQF